MLTGVIWNRLEALSNTNLSNALAKRLQQEVSRHTTTTQETLVELEESVKDKGSDDEDSDDFGGLSDISTDEDMAFELSTKEDVDMSIDKTLSPACCKLIKAVIGFYGQLTKIMGLIEEPEKEETTQLLVKVYDQLNTIQSHLDSISVATYPPQNKPLIAELAIQVEAIIMSILQNLVALSQLEKHAATFGIVTKTLANVISQARKELE